MVDTYYLQILSCKFAYLLDLFVTPQINTCSTLGHSHTDTEWQQIWVAQKDGPSWCSAFLLLSSSLALSSCWSCILCAVYLVPCFGHFAKKAKQECLLRQKARWGSGQETEGAGSTPCRPRPPRHAGEGRREPGQTEASGHVGQDSGPSCGEAQARWSHRTRNDLVIIWSNLLILHLQNWNSEKQSDLAKVTKLH